MQGHKKATQTEPKLLTWPIWACHQKQRDGSLSTYCPYRQLQGMAVFSGIFEVD
jgi:hypothetical protein